MKKIKYKTSKIFEYLWLISLMMFSSCGDDEVPGGQTGTDETFRPVQMTPISGVRVAWDYSSMQQIANLGAMPKMVRVNNQTLVAVYEWNGNAYLVKSVDNGVSWGAAVTIFARGSHTGVNGTANITYTDLMVQPAVSLLSDGTLVAACAVKYQYTLLNVVTEFPAALKLRRINSETLALEPVMDVYANHGVENPSFLLLPDGRLQLYFANGATPQPVRILNSTEMNPELFEQHVAVIESSDNGHTWSSFIKDFGTDGVDRRWTGARTVASRSHKKNVWPSPAIVGEEIVVSLADNKILNYKPYTVRTPLDQNWKYAVNGDTRDREYALYEILPDKYLMNVPCLLVLPSGETVLSYETDEGRNDGFEVMELAVGNHVAYDFKYRSRPFPFNANEKAVGNSLMLFDEQTIVALTGSNRNTTPTQTAPWFIKGYLLNDLTVSSDQINDYPIFVSGHDRSSLRAGLGIDANNLYVSVKVVDNTPVSAEVGTTQGDGVFLYIDAANLSLLSVDEGISKFWIPLAGDIIRWNGKEGRWVQASSDGVTVSNSVLSNGYTLDVAIPRSKLTNFNAQGIRFAIALNDYTDTDNGATEMLSLCQDLRSSTWLGVKF